MVVLGAMAVPVGLIVRNSAQEQLDARLQQQASVIAATVTAQLATGPTLRHDELSELLGDGDGLLVLEPDGDVMLDLRSPEIDASRTMTAVASGGQRIIVETDADPVDDDV